MNSQELLKELIWFDTTKCFIDGAWKKPLSKQYIELFDPSNNSPICKIPRSNKSDVNLAVQSAQNSLNSNWGSFSSLERGRILNKIGLLVHDKIDQLAKIVDAVGDKIDVICEGGIQRGTHILKALSTGAKACAGGRLYLYALASAGQKGVERALVLLKNENSN